MGQWVDSTSLIFDRQVFLVTGLGDRLKEARTAKGYTLDDLQTITKIQKRYLEGIENEEFGSMPGSYYVRAFIKQYAEAVGLDADEMLSLYRDTSGSIEPKEEDQAVTPTLSRRGSSRGNSQLTEMMPKIIVALFIVVIFGAMWFLYQNMLKTGENDVDKDEPITVIDQQKSDDGQKGSKTTDDKEVEDEPDPEPETTEQVLKHVTTAGQDSTYSLTDATEFKVEIKTAGESWIAMLDNNQVERTQGARVMKAGETSGEMDVGDATSVRIRVGLPTSTEIYVNDELLEYESDGIPQNIIIEYEKE